MSTPILATKLFIPAPGDKLVLRPRLIERMNESLLAGRKLTLVSAPAGFGKTTLVSEWIADCEQPAAWLSLEEGDNNTTRFLTYLVAALQTISTNIGKATMGLLQSPQPASVESILTLLINEVNAFEEKFILVFDDYHVLDAKPIDDALTFLLDHLPPQMHLVITTREDPHLPLARLRARGELNELRVTDLRFTDSEAAEFLNRMAGLNLSAEEISALEVRTEGWIAGLQLAALSMQGHQDTAGFIKSFTGSHHFILDYLLEEVLNQQPENIQTFLLHTSILDRLCGSLCDAVLLDPSASAQDTLENIERANLFIIPLDNERRWYRYHHLFAELLRQRLASSSEKNNAAEYHIRASIWYEENNLVGESFHHAIAARDFKRAAGLAEQAWPAMDGSFQSSIWLGWAKTLPEDLIRAMPVFSVAYAWALLNAGEMEAGEARLRDAERWLETSSTEMIVVDEKQFQTLPASIATARAYIAQSRGDIPGAVKYGEQALELLPQEDHLKRGPAAALLSLAHWASGNLEAAHRTLADAMFNFKLIGSISFSISGTYGLADIRIAQGRLRDAISDYQSALQLAAQQGEPVPTGTADLYLGLSEIYREQGDLESAAQHLLKSEELGESAALKDWPYRLCRAKAQFKAEQRDFDDALDLLDEAERVYFRSPVPNVRPISAFKARVWIQQGRLAEALSWARARNLSSADDLSYLREFEHITLARILMRMENSILDTTNLLERILKAAEDGGRNGSVIEVLILQALVYEAQGNISAALPPLNRALILAEPEGYIRIFVNEGQPMARLLSEAAAHGVMPDYAGKLLAAFQGTARGEKQPSSSLIESLSQRELEVLQLIAQGLSNDEISKKLFLALDTVKGHNRKIFSKLQVQRRTEAVARARELGLV